MLVGWVSIDFTEELVNLIREEERNGDEKNWSKWPSLQNLARFVSFCEGDL